MRTKDRLVMYEAPAGLHLEVADGPLRDLPGRTFEFASRVVRLCNELEKSSRTSRTLTTQLLRSACSVGANVEEGQGSQTRADFTTKYSIACKEAREAHYWLRLLKATDLIPPSRLDSLIDEANQLVAILTSIVKKTKAPAKDPK